MILLGMILLYLKTCPAFKYPESTFMTFIGMDTGDTLNCDTGGAGAGETGMSYSSVGVLGS